MSRYIDADTAKINLSALKKYNNSHGIILAADEEAISEWIDKQPSADVRENVRAEWQVVGYDKDYIPIVYTCSACGFRTTMELEFDFCPNCGADMRHQS